MHKTLTIICVLFDKDIFSSNIRNEFDTYNPGDFFEIEQTDGNEENCFKKDGGIYISCYLNHD